MVDTSKINTLAVAPVQTGGGVPAAADSTPNSIEADSPKNVAQLEDGGEGEAAALGAACAADPVGARRPGQRALLRLRKKCAAGQGQSIKEGLVCDTVGAPGPGLAI